MKLHYASCFLLLALLFSFSNARKTSSGSRKSGSSGSFTRKGTSKPSSQTSYGSVGGGSKPGTIGWNVPKQQSPSTHVKPSAPVSDHISKTSATNVQSGYKPSGGYGQQTGGSFGQSGGTHYNPQPASQGYNPPVNSGYQPGGSYGGYNSHGTGQGGYNSHGTGQGGYYPQGGGYHPPSSGGYHPPASGGYHPQAGGQPYQPYSGYNSNLGHSYQPGAGYNPPVAQAPQTIYVQSAGQPYKPGIGQIAKEAFVYAGVSAGVNAAVNRILPGGIYGTHGSSGGSNGGVAAPPAVTHTQITYNNYYNNGTSTGEAPAANSNNPAQPVQNAPAQAAPNAASNTPMNAAPAAAAVAAAPAANAPAASPQNPPAAPPPTDEDSIFPVKRADIQQFTEDLLTKDVNNAAKWVTVRLQGQKMDDSVKDDAPETLLVVKDEAWSVPTIKSMLNLHDNYEFDVHTKEVVTSEERTENDAFLDAILETEVMKATMKFLADKGYVPNDTYEFKDLLKRMWFTQFKRMEGEPSSSGFETVFLAEKFDNEIIGLHNWVYYAKMEASGKLNYLGYIKESSFSDKGSVVKVRSSLNDIVQPITSLFVGTSPELEIALYTMCFYTRPGYPCPVKLSGKDFVIIANRANYFGTDIVVSAFPDL